MLQIRVDQHGCAATAIGKIQARQHGGLLAEVAGEFQQRQPLIGMGLLPSANHRNRCVGGAVVDQQQPGHLWQGQDAFNEADDHRLLVETSRHHPELLAAHANPAVMSEP